MNKVILIGSVGADPEIKKFDNGGAVARASLVTTKHWKSKNGEKQSKTNWHQLQIPEFLHNVLNYVKKGSKIAVEGEVEYREHEGKYYTDIRVNSIELLDSKSSGGGNSPNDIEKSFEGRQKSTDGGDEVDEDDLPF